MQANEYLVDSNAILTYMAISYINPLIDLRIEIGACCTAPRWALSLLTDRRRRGVEREFVCAEGTKAASLGKGRGVLSYADVRRWNAVHRLNTRYPLGTGACDPWTKVCVVLVLC